MGDDITQLTREVSDLRGDVRALIARVDEQLSQGADTMKDHESRLRELERNGARAIGAAVTLGTAAGGVAGTLLGHVWH